MSVTDLDGRTIPTTCRCIYIDNMMACPRNLDGDKLVPDYATC